MDIMYSSARSSVEAGSWTYMTDTIAGNDGSSLRVYSRNVDWSVFERGKQERGRRSAKAKLTRLLAIGTGHLLRS